MKIKLLYYRIFKPKVYRRYKSIMLIRLYKEFTGAFVKCAMNIYSIAEHNNIADMLDVDVETKNDYTWEIMNTKQDN